MTWWTDAHIDSHRVLIVHMYLHILYITHLSFLRALNALQSICLLKGLCLYTYLHTYHICKYMLVYMPACPSVCTLVCVKTLASGHLKRFDRLLAFYQHLIYSRT